MQFKIYNNTDTVDIRAESLGLSVRTDGPDVLNTNRGLKIQIRHNKDKATFEAANDLASLVSAAPELLAQLKLVQEYLAAKDVRWTGIDAALAKAEGRE
jgi:hypothetical protein